MVYDGPERRALAPCQDHKRMVERVDDLHRAIYGNGEPKKGILWKTEKTHDFVDNFQKNAKALLFLIVPACLASILGFVFMVAKVVFQHA